MANIQKKKKQQMLVRVWRKGTPPTLLVELQIGVTTVENSVGLPQKIKIRGTIWPSNSTPRFLPKENKISDSKRYMHPYVNHHTFCNSQDMEAT